MRKALALTLASSVVLLSPGAGGTESVLRKMPLATDAQTEALPFATPRFDTVPWLNSENVPRTLRTDTLLLRDRNPVGPFLVHPQKDATSANRDAG